MGKVIKIAQPGKDVSRANDDELILSSEFNMFKIAKIVEGNYKPTISEILSYNFNFTFFHNLGYTPSIIGTMWTGAKEEHLMLPYTLVPENYSYWGKPMSLHIVITKITKQNVKLAVTIHDLAGQSWMTNVGTMHFKLYCLRESTA